MKNQARGTRKGVEALAEKLSVTIPELLESNVIVRPPDRG